MRGDPTNSRGGQEASAPEKKKGTTRGRGVTRGGQMEAPLNRMWRRTRGNMISSILMMEMFPLRKNLWMLCKLKMLRAS